MYSSPSGNRGLVPVSELSAFYKLLAVRTHKTRNAPYGVFSGVQLPCVTYCCMYIHTCRVRST